MAESQTQLHLIIDVDLGWLEHRLGRENVDKIISALVSSNDAAHSAICVDIGDEIGASCRPGNDSLILDLLSSLIDE